MTPKKGGKKVKEVESNEETCMPFHQFERSVLLDLMNEGKAEEMKKYVKNYFYKSIKPLGTYLYDPLDNTFTFNSTTDVKREVLHKLAFDMKINDEYELNRKVSFDVCEWFYNRDSDYYRPSIEPNKQPVFEEEKDGCKTKYVNFFRGFLHKRKPYDSYDQKTKSAVDLILSHIQNVWCSGNENIYNYLINWFSCALTGGRKMNTALYLKSTQGTGKSIITEFICDKVIGDSFFISSKSDVVTSWNEQLVGKLVMNLEELALHSEKQWEEIDGILNHAITGKTLEIKQKYHDTYKTRNIVSVIINTNKSAVRISPDSRRYFCLDISENKVGQYEYFIKLADAMDMEGVGEAFFNFMCEHFEKSGKDFKENRMPLTNTKKELINEYLDPFTSWIKNKYVLKGLGINTTFDRLYSMYSTGNPETSSKNFCCRKLTHLGIEKKKSSEIRNKTTYTVRKINISFKELLEKFNEKGFIDENVDAVPQEEAANNEQENPYEDSIVKKKEHETDDETVVDDEEIDELAKESSDYMNKYEDDEQEADDNKIEEYKSKPKHKKRTYNDTVDTVVSFS